MNAEDREFDDTALKFCVWSTRTLCGACLQTVRRRAEGEEKTLAADVKTSPPRTAPKKAAAICSPKHALPITKPTSPAPAAQSRNGTQASYGPFYLGYSLLAEFILAGSRSYQEAMYSHRIALCSCDLEQYSHDSDCIRMTYSGTVCIPANYPDGDCPRLLFDIPVLHPLADST